LSDPARHDFAARQGDTSDRGITLTEDDGTPVDLTDAEIEFSFAVSAGRSPSFTYTTADYITLTAPADGGFEIDVPASVTAGWPPRRYLHELSITLASGRRFTLMQGHLDVSPDYVT